jgi:hypothetical protein
MSFDIFGEAQKDSIKVGYISTDRGFVDNVTICEANHYAQRNPGTQFVFKTRSFVKYLNINEVNNLTPNDLVSSEKSCEGIVLEKECGPAKVYFYGGGGVGVQGNPVIGLDGSLLAVDLIHSGYGYQYPPIVEVTDSCGIGAGSVVRAILGEVIETVEYYDQENDYEDYNFELCDTDEITYGLRYDPNGNVIGKWDPTIYANLDKDPIRREIQEYQDFLQRLSKPWWTTRKEAPLRLTSSNKITRTKFDVTDEPFLEKQRAAGVKDPVAWNAFMNRFAISPVPPSNVPGSDFAGIPFTFEWEENFPYDGEYVFKGLCDNSAQLYLDNQLIDNLRGFRDTPNAVRRNVKSGVHRIRIDLLNLPVEENPPQQSSSQGSSGGGGGNLAIGYAGLNPENKSLNVKQNKEVLIKDGEGNDANAIFAIDSFDRGMNAKISGDGKKILFDKPGKITVSLTWSDNPNTFGVAVQSISVGGVTLKQTGNSGKVKKSFFAGSKPTIEAGKSTNSSGPKTRNVFNTSDYINKADKKLWKTNIGRGFRDADFANRYGVMPFDPSSSRAQREGYPGVHVIRWSNIDFPVDGNYTIETWVDDNATIYIGNRDGGGSTNIGNGLRSVDNGGDEIIIRKRGYTGPGQSTGKSVDTKFFKAGKYRIRAELEQANFGPLSVNPMVLAINIVATGSEKVVTARSWNDNPMGVAVRIDAPLPPIPQEPIVQQEGRCPNNPIWSTRFPNSQERWWPVSYSSAMAEAGITRWSKFLDRYAISPVPPRNTPGSDGSGVVYRNSWTVDIPYDGFYTFAAQRDETARIYVDGSLAFDITTAGNIEWKDFRNKPKFQKVFISRGRKTISVELEQKKTDTLVTVEKKIFTTRDWLVKPAPANVKKGETTKTEEWVQVDDVFIPPKYQSLGGGRGPFGPVGDVAGPDASFHRYNEGTWYKGKRIRSGGDWNNTNPKSNYIQWDENTRLTLGKYYAGQGQRFGIAVWKKKTKETTAASESSAPAPDIQRLSATAPGIVYDGPTPIANYLGDLISPALGDVNAVPNPEIQNKTWVFKWSNVDFPEDGQYTIEHQADDIMKLKIDGKIVSESYSVFEGRRKSQFNISKGKKTLEFELSNIAIENSGFDTNPTYFFAEITKKQRVSSGITKSWTQNPIALSAILIPPPCPKRIRGRGVVTDVEVDDPGNSYPAPLPQLDNSLLNVNPTYPVSLRLKDVKVLDPGINYNCGVDQIIIEPSNGAVLDYVCDTFGRIIEIKVLNPGLGFTEYPNIRIDTSTGINATFAPQFEVVRDPIVLDEAKLIQVTDLVGLKQTGYVDGRAYYGAVFYKEGVRYAGFYETAGELVQVYDTLKESIDAQVVTPPSAIQRQGTDISSNDPRFNIPGTPEELI